MTRVSVLLCDPRDATDDEVAAALAPLQSTERERAARFRFAHLRRDYAVAHALVRVALSREAPVAHGSWTYRTNSHGHPTIDCPAGTGLRFSLSHTEGLVGVATASELEVGFDCERTTSDPETLALAESHFAPTEASAVREELADPSDAFFRFWTLKEAYIKARGLGLELPLDGFWFEPRGDRPKLRIDANRIKDDGHRWASLRWRDGDHALAVVAERGGTGAELQVSVARLTVRELVMELRGGRNARDVRHAWASAGNRERDGE
ncbi:MAG: 4'-phosphopantetheinyl transferase superfamily protein [Myxococcales bacterium]|nr:4'-phosphopantetheinyl transferase superfamily protein [Myxococcales bacterium]